LAGQLQIINVALSRIGANELTSLTQGTTEQKLAVNMWDIARRSSLRDHTWNFAIQDVELNQISGYSGFEFQYAYQLPSDCVRLLQVYGNPIYKVQGRKILTDQSIAKIKYVKDVVDSSEWDASFDDVMAQRLAADMAYALTKSQATADSMFAIYDRKLKSARHIDSTEDVQDMLGGTTSPYIGVRG
jgi:hypothetical protein